MLVLACTPNKYIILISYLFFGGVSVKAVAEAVICI